MHYLFSLKEPVIYYKSGEFITKNKWKHKSMNHNGDYEIIFCINGPIYLKINDKNIVIKKNEIVIIPPYTPIEGYKYSNNLVDFYWIHFFTNQKNTKIQNIYDFNIHNTLNKNEIILPEHFYLKETQEILLLMHQILSIKKINNLIEERDFLITSLLIHLFNLLKLNYNSDNDNETLQKINIIKEWIRVNINSNLTVMDIANHFHLNPDYLTRIFKIHTQMTTLQYLINIKIEVAIILLMRTEMSIKEIAYHSYFNDEKTFSRRFKLIIGVSPTEYRRNHHLIHLNNANIDPKIPISKRISDLLDNSNENI